MADQITFHLDAAGVIAALNRAGDAMQPFINAAAQVTADAIVQEARGRLARQLGPHATGVTVAAITSRPAYDKNGYVVVVERDPFPNLPLWLEKGTKKGKGTHANVARPFFYSSALLEEGNHLRRISEAVQQGLEAQGLGD